MSSGASRSPLIVTFSRTSYKKHIITVCNKVSYKVLEIICKEYNLLAQKLTHAVYGNCTQESTYTLMVLPGEMCVYAGIKGIVSVHKAKFRNVTKDRTTIEPSARM